jgi:sRNA-binding carbon storage regulator CsrA
VKLAIEAPREVPVHREEVRRRIDVQQRLAVVPTGEHLPISCEASCF